MTRRSFCFLFGAGVAASVLPLPSAESFTLGVEWPVFQPNGSAAYYLMSVDLPGGNVPDIDTLIAGLKPIEPITITGYFDR